MTSSQYGQGDFNSSKEEDIPLVVRHISLPVWFTSHDRVRGGDPVLQGQPAGQQRPARGEPQDPPVDHPGGQLADDRHLQDAGQ
jgi:hypothetical protein